MKRVLLLVHDLFEEMELLYPKYRLLEAGAQCVIAGEKKGVVYAGKHGYPCTCDVSFFDVKAGDFDALVIPGGFAPDKLRRFQEVLSITKDMNDKKKPIGFICHGGWVPISAKILKGRTVTGFMAIKDDLENAGAHYVDKAVVVDGNLISSRTPKDLPDFGKALVEKCYE